MSKGYAKFFRGESSNAVLAAGEERVSTILPTQSNVEGRNDSLVKDVFLSHSGKQKGVVRQVHQDLKKQDISCFFDEDPQSLPVAEKFPDRIFEATEKCRIAVVFISKEFINSKWPMLELSAFLKAKNSGKNPHMKILPVFFMMSPKSLSEISKDNQEWKDLGISDEIRVEWHCALREIRSFNGLEIREVEDLVDFKDKVVKAICSLLLPQSPSSMQAQAHQHQVVYGLASIPTTLSSTSAFSNNCYGGCSRAYCTLLLSMDQLRLQPRTSYYAGVLHY